MSYRIKIDQFEGPFDLILFFIERDELDINDIPIAKITKDFLTYIRELEEMNIDVASEFILVAATLMRIKAKMLIPRKEKNELGEEIDPREELTRRLIEYKRFKDVLDEFREKEDTQSKKLKRGNVEEELSSIAQKALVDVEIESVSLFKLMNVFHNLLAGMEGRKQKVRHKIFDYTYTIEDQQEYIFKQIRMGGRMSFADLVMTLDNRVHAIVTFLALLDLVSLQEVKIVQGEGMNNFWIQERTIEDEEE